MDGTEQVSRYAAPLRDLAKGRVRDYDLRLRRFDDTDWQRYGALLAVAFALAVGRRFRPGQDRAPVIRMVAGVRERYDHTGRDLDPGTAEALVWAALGEHPPVPMDRAAIATQTLLLIGLLNDEGLSPTDLDTFLQSAEDLTQPAEDA
nr:hypothetical protein [Micromonospora sp. DSM 115978]